MSEAECLIEQGYLQWVVPWYVFAHRPNLDLPWRHEWIEIAREGGGNAIVIRSADMPEETNVWGLWWRPAKEPST